MNNFHALKRNISHVSIGSPLTRVGLSLFPVYVHGPSAFIATGPSAGVSIGEKPDAEVPTLEVVNPTERPVLLVDGEVVAGGLQTRVLNVSVLVGANQRLDIPVSCVEQGRWSGQRDFRQGATFASRRVRRVKNDTVFSNVARSGRKATDQGMVWRAISAELDRLEVHAHSGTLEAADQFLAAHGAIAEAAAELKQFGPLPEQRGLVVAHGSRVISAEVFASTEMLAAHWEALVGSLVLDAPPAGATSRPSATSALRFLDRLVEAEATVAPGVGLGSEYHVRTRSLVAQALVHDHMVVHASAFALAA